MTKKKRRPKQSREDLRTLLIATGRRLVIEEGLGVGVETLTFKKVFTRVEAETGLRLSNASVIRRVWENQADYQADVLATIAATDGLGEFEATVRALGPLIDNLDLSTPDSRRRSLSEVCRVGGAANIVQLLESPHWSTWVAVWTLATAQDVEGHDQLRHQQRIRDALFEGYAGFTSLWEGAYGALARLVGMRVRAPLTMRQLSVAVGALAEGCSLRERVDPHLQGITRPTGVDGEAQDWTLFGIGLEALCLHFLEPDPDWVPEGSTGRDRSSG
jgi:hypothetical protein